MMNFTLKKVVIVVGIVCVIIVVPLCFIGFTQKYSKIDTFKHSGYVMRVATSTINVDIAVTPSELVTGLSGRDSLPSDRVMLFVFPTSDYPEIWMKDMKFPIDIIWLGDNLAITDIKNDISPETYPETFKPKTKSRYVIEAQAGFVSSYNLKVGQSIIFLGN